ncbi:MAG: universal stress protein [Nitrosomonadales bacterium]|nr:universal stress protein [Nitrosomonadales bacterium]
MNTHPFFRLLLASEHTEFDVGAERVALEMAHSCGLPLNAVLPVLSNPEFEAAAPQLAERAEREAATKIAALRAQAQQAGVELNIVARHGSEPYREIVDEATRCDSDLIIVRRRGKQGFLARLLVGEMVSKVVSHAPCSVLFVPRAAHMWSHGVLAAIDSSVAATRVATVAAAIAARCGLPLTFISVASHDTPTLRAEAEKNLASAMNIASAAGANALGRILIGKAFELILAAAKTQGTDLIVIGRHGESNVVRAPLGGTTQKVLGLAESPVLVVRN